MVKRNFKIKETIFIDNIDWQDEEYGVIEDTIEYTTDSNHKLYVTYKLTVEVGWDGKQKSYLEVDEIYVENPFGKPVEITDDEYESIEKNFRKVIKW